MTARRMWVAVRIVGLVCIVRLWLMPLASSLWIDELGSVFVVRMGADHPSLAVAPQVPASVHFWIPRAVQWLLNQAPHSRAAPGFWKHFIACRRSFACAPQPSSSDGSPNVFHPQAAWFAVFACLALRGFDYQAADARPYALGTLTAAAWVYFLIRWLDAARWLDAGYSWLRRLYYGAFTLSTGPFTSLSWPVPQCACFARKRL